VPLTEKVTEGMTVSRRTQAIISDASPDGHHVASIRSLLLERDLCISDIDILTVSEIKAALGHDVDSLEHVAFIAHISAETLETAATADPSCSVYNLRNLFKDVTDVASALCVWRNSGANIHSLRAHLAACGPDVSLLAQLSGSMHISDALVTLRVLRNNVDFGQQKRPQLSL
jgi:hypothetical protein